MIAVLQTGILLPIKLPEKDTNILHHIIVFNPPNSNGNHAQLHVNN